MQHWPWLKKTPWWAQSTAKSTRRAHNTGKHRVKCLYEALLAEQSGEGQDRGEHPLPLLSTLSLSNQTKPLGPQQERGMSTTVGDGGSMFELPPRPRKSSDLDGHLHTFLLHGTAEGLPTLAEPISGDFPPPPPRGTILFP